jgi:hypothetical protein
MAIYRAPLATKSFTQVPNHWLRDGNLSARAKGILSYICSHAPGYELTVKQMVAEMKDGQDAIYAGMKELEEAGYLVRQRQRAERGRLGGVNYTIVESPESDTSYSGSTRTGETKTGGTRSGEPKSGGSVTKNNNPKNTKDLEDGSDQISTTFGGGDENSRSDDGLNDDPWVDVQQPDRNGTEELTDARANDRALFHQLVGEKLVSFGAKWKPAGTYPAEMLYGVFRSRRNPPIKWPGRFLESLYDQNPTSGVADWLADQGLEMP